MSAAETDRIVSRHLTRMRAVAILFIASQGAAAALALALPRHQLANPRPLSVTIAALLLGLWLTFTADRHARRLLARVKHGFAGHRDEAQLLNHHLWVYVRVLTRLEVVTVCAVATAVWGFGPAAGMPFLLVVATLMALSWPTRRKTLLLLERAKASGE